MEAYSKASSYISHCVAINPVILCTGTSEYCGRVVGYKMGTSNANLGFADMYNYYGNEWFQIGETNLDGESISKEQIMADGTFGNKFIADNGWTTQNGKLPGFGAPVDLPDFMTEPAVVNITECLPLPAMKQPCRLRLWQLQHSIIQ